MEAQLLIDVIIMPVAGIDEARAGDYVTADVSVQGDLVVLRCGKVIGTGKAPG